MDNVIFIDWISPTNHRTFNNSLFQCIGWKNTEYFIFNESLRVQSQINRVVKSKSNRYHRAAAVIRLILNNKKKKIILITYDPIFVIFARLITNQLYTIEHNTTPEPPRYLKHAVWQRLFLRWLKRLALFHEQVSVLKLLKQNFAYIGSPIPLYKSNDGQRISREKKYFLSPSYRSDLKDLTQLKHLFFQTPLFVKATSEKALTEIELDGVEVQLCNFVDLEKEKGFIKAIIISGDTGVRLSGWINESLGYNIPILAANTEIENAIQKNFPDFRFLRGSEIKKGRDVDEILEWVLQGSNDEKILENNIMVAQRFSSALGIKEST